MITIMTAVIITVMTITAAMTKMKILIITMKSNRLS